MLGRRIESSMKSYDYVVVGAGAAGFAAAVKLSELSDGGARVALVNGGRIGGTCVNVGCIPSKYLIENSKLYFEGKRKRYRAVNLTTSLDFKALMEDLRNLTAILRREKYKEVLSRFDNVELLNGIARFNGPGSVKVVRDGSETEITAEKYLIATGSRPHPPPIKGLEEVGYLDSDTLWKLEEQPGSMLVIGAGAIGLEIGQAMQRLGTQVIMVEALDRILPTTEPEISEELRKALVDEGMEIYTKARVARIYIKEGRKIVQVLTREGDKNFEVDEVFVATGRRPNTDGLGLENVGVDVDERGFVKVDRTMRTSNPRIYAAGDVVSKKLMLETLAAREGVIAALNMAGERAEIDYSSVPIVTFTEPQVASVGLTERELMERIKSCTCRLVEVSNTSKAVLTHEGRGIAKLVVNPYDNKVVGLHIMSPNAAEFILAGAVMLKAGYTVDEMLDLVHVFPTYAESIKLVATAFIRSVKAMPCCME
jgi:mercuric reductase